MIGDIDGGDGPELFVSSTRWEGERPDSAQIAVYLLPGARQRRHGDYTLGHRDIFRVTLAGNAAPPASSPDFRNPFALAGDVDGDGGSDLLAASESGAVILVPSTPRAPD